MRQTLGWVMVVMVCCLGSAAAGQGSPPPPDARRVDARAEYDAAEKLKKAGEYFKALPRARRALELQESVLGSTHPDVAAYLSLSGALHRMQGHLTQAEPLLNRALDLRKAALGERDPQVAQSLSDLADLYLDQGRYDEAKDLIERALDLRKAAFGERDPQVANSLNDLAVVHVVQMEYGKAEDCLKRAIELRTEAFGETHEDVAHAFNDLGTLYLTRGRYEKAEELLRKAIDINKQILGRGHPDVALAATNLASLHVTLGRYSRAESLFRDALDIYKAISGNAAREANSLNNLAMVYMAQGALDKAENCLESALALRETTLGERHHRYADSLNNLAHVHMLRKRYDRAEPLLNRALSIHEATLGPSHPTLAYALTNLANIALTQRRYDRARRLVERTLALRRHAFGERHPEVAKSLGMLASLAMAQGDYARAEQHLEHALTLLKKPLSESHPDTVNSLRKLAQVRLAQQRLDDALPLLERVFTLSEGRLRYEALGFSESRLSSFLDSLREDEELLYALLRAHPEEARVQRLALRASLLLKGRSVEETAQVSRTIYQYLDPRGRDSFERLRVLRTRMSRSLAGEGSFSPEEFKALAEEGDALQEELARSSAPLRALFGLASPQGDVVDRAAAALPRDGALVEFVSSADRPLIPPPGTPPASASGPGRYLALVLFPDASLRAVDLGPKADIDRAAAGLRDALAHQSKSFQASARQLHWLVFEPLRPLLGSTRRLLVSPDGQLGLVPFAALHDGQAFLLDSFDFTYLTSGRDLLPRPQDVLPSSSVVVLADPDFSALTGCASQSSLPATRLEAEGIQHLLPQSQLFLGAEASKQRLFDLPTPGILHLATHGFFRERSSSPSGTQEPVATVVERDLLAAPSERNEGTFAGECKTGVQQEPLLNSGLVLAGVHAPGAAAPAVESYLATALELAGLNLWGTQLVVLSACETGRGQVQLGQGIYGLRRALVVAGAETVVMSLWNVSDGFTSELMKAYYLNLLKGQGRASALTEAMRSLRATHPHPYHWAPFIALGRDAPLRAIAAPEPQAPAAQETPRK